jgi:transposase
VLVIEETGNLPAGKMLEQTVSVQKQTKEVSMRGYYYIGLDIHKKSIEYCVKRADGDIVDEGRLSASRPELLAWVKGIKKPWFGGMEATLFTGWVYDFLRPYAKKLKVAHPYMLRAISASKKKNDRIDARKLADALRCEWFPESHMAPKDVRDLRQVLRYRNLMVREATRMKNKAASLLMEVGVEYNKKKLHGERYFSALLKSLDDVPDSVIELLDMSHSGMEVFESNQKRLLNALENHPILKNRIERLMSIPGVGVVTALTWALEIDDPHRFSSHKKVVSYCGLCSALRESAGKIARGPLSKQRNKHLQTILVEAAKLAPRWNPQLQMVYEKERGRGANHNRATLAVARKLAAYLLHVDKTGEPFVMRVVN